MTDHLQQFARQLALWTTQIIEHGRTPFRRVDCFPRLATDIGILTPPLVLWINRQSMMAGGVILIPEPDVEMEPFHGRHCADALGLSHFITWEKQQVRLWRVGSEELIEQQRFPLPGTDHPEFFLHLLRDLIEALKLPAITGAVPQSQLSACYFTNLFLITLELAQPSITDAFRSHRTADPFGATVEIDELAVEANKLLLLQLLTAYRHGLLSETSLPERLETTLTQAVSGLPEPLRSDLSHRREQAPPRLPAEAAVCYHHLLLRLHQLRLREPESRLCRSLQQLIALWNPDEHPLSETIAIHPAGTPTDERLALIVTDSPLTAAATSIARELAGVSSARILYGRVFDLDRESLPPGPISANLLNTALISKEQRSMIQGYMRSSWPHRSFGVRTDQPYWQWELLHLLGICKPLQQLTIRVPIELLKQTRTPLWPLLVEHYQLLELDTSAGGSIAMLLIRAPRENRPTRIKNADGSSSELVLDEDAAVSRDQILAAVSTAFAGTHRPTQPETPPAIPSKNLKQEIIDRLATVGLPNFPDQYLYFIDSPTMIRYSFIPPLIRTSHLLGQYELQDADGRIFKIYGEELEEALMICAKIGKIRVDLPKDRRQLETILHHYRKDLAGLYHQLEELCYLRLEKPQAARNLIRNIWKSLKLPDREWFKN